MIGRLVCANDPLIISNRGITRYNEMMYSCKFNDEARLNVYE